VLGVALAESLLTKKADDDAAPACESGAEMTSAIVAAIEDDNAAAAPSPAPAIADASSVSPPPSPPAEGLTATDGTRGATITIAQRKTATGTCMAAVKKIGEDIGFKTLGKVFFGWVVTLPLVGIVAMGLNAFLLPAVLTSAATGAQQQPIMYYPTNASGDFVGASDDDSRRLMEIITGAGGSDGYSVAQY